MPSETPDPFESAEAYYAAYRPGYGDATVDYLRERYALDDAARVLDLGCGAGQLAVPLAAHAGEVVGVDPSEEMLRHARRRADAAGRENFEWVVGSDADLGPALGTFRLATMGRSFHWTDQERTLDRLSDLTEPGGGVAIVTDEELLTRGTADWQVAVYRVAERYVDDLPERDPDPDYDDPWDEKLETFGFGDVAVETIDLRRRWSVDEVVGYVFSLSYCSPATLGDDRGELEAALRSRLDELGPGPFVQDVTVEVIAGRT